MVASPHRLVEAISVFGGYGGQRIPFFNHLESGLNSLLSKSRLTAFLGLEEGRFRFCDLQVS
jgi:hypothetical protein